MMKRSRRSGSLARGTSIAAAAILLLLPRPGAGEPRRGDVDGDEAVNITDGINIFSFLFVGSFTPYCRPVADANGDGVVNISDPITLVSFLFLDGIPLPELTPEERQHCSSVNLPPAVRPPPLYRSFPGFPIACRIDASDPEGNYLLYEASALPQGAFLEPSTGILRWTPAAGQLGTFPVPFTVREALFPQNRVGGTLVFHIQPLDACVEPGCDPARGCEPVPLPLTRDCCGSPAARVPEPLVPCPAGRVLDVGRNGLGSPTIGRMQNCDALRLVPLGQGGHEARLNLEARCLDPLEATVTARLETSAVVLFDEAARRTLERQRDGSLQLLGQSFIAEGLFFDGMEAQLTVTLTDRAGAQARRTLRLVLTREPVSDLP